MSMNDTPQANRVHIGFFGRRNAGKSSLVNAVTGQDLVIVSEIKGTTTDPVSKSMELLPLGPVLIIDTPGIDDEGALGEQRIRKARQVLNKTDVAVLAVDAAETEHTGGELSGSEKELIALFREKNIPYIIAYNKSDLLAAGSASRDKAGPAQANPVTTDAGPAIFVSAKTGAAIRELKEQIAALAKTEDFKLRIVGDLVKPGDFVVLVTPIDSAAPKGRMILPQQQTIRDVLEADAAAMVVKEFQLKETLEQLGKKPALVVTDSQAFARVSADTPPDIPLTSFSILFARLKGFLAAAVRGVTALDHIEDGDKILICEGCTHHRQCDDIGTVKLPRWIKQHTGKNPEFAFTSGGEFPGDLSPYKLVLHCGACMLNEREMKYRRDCAADQNIPFTNYGIAIAHIQGILKRSLGMFPGLLNELQ
ncbi:[FeFe] hydrogenase H-cluster maturation GTPase HydF [Spirochaetia bacterium]|nr:[FeFe] hydrogenase H-cluster maturation GTPase HydF [Spirochaetia bacterium]